MTKLLKCPTCETSQLSFEERKEHCLKIHGKPFYSLIPWECSECQQEMRKIVDESILSVQCVNEKCNSYKEILEAGAGETVFTIP